MIWLESYKEGKKVEMEGRKGDEWMTLERWRGK